MKKTIQYIKVLRNNFIVHLGTKQLHCPVGHETISGTYFELILLTNFFLERNFHKSNSFANKIDVMSQKQQCHGEISIETEKKKVGKYKPFMNNNIKEP